LCDRATWSSNIYDVRTFLRESIDPVMNRFTWQTHPTVERKSFFMNILCIESIFPEEYTHNWKLLFGSISATTVAIFTTETSLWICSWAYAIRMLWIWTVLLPSGTCRKPITFITAVSLPFVAYLLTLPRN
jgi:hypothetical protein